MIDDLVCCEMLCHVTTGEAASRRVRWVGPPRSRGSGQLMTSTPLALPGMRDMHGTHKLPPLQPSSVVRCTLVPARAAPRLGPEARRRCSRVSSDARPRVRGLPSSGGRGRPPRRGGTWRGRRGAPAHAGAGVGSRSKTACAVAAGEALHRLHQLPVRHADDGSDKHGRAGQGERRGVAEGRGWGGTPPRGGGGSPPARGGRRRCINHRMPARGGRRRRAPALPSVASLRAPRACPPLDGGDGGDREWGLLRGRRRGREGRRRGRGAPRGSIKPGQPRRLGCVRLGRDNRRPGRSCGRQRRRRLLRRRRCRWECGCRRPCAPRRRLEPTQPRRLGCRLGGRRRRRCRQRCRRGLGRSAPRGSIKPGQPRRLGCRLGGRGRRRCRQRCRCRRRWRRHCCY